MVKIMAARYAELDNRSYDEVFERMLHYSRKFQKKIIAKK